jgi:cytochrome c oxidase subunit 1
LGHAWVGASLLLVVVLPLLVGAMLLMLADRRLGTGFYQPEKGGDPLVYQHLFWMFGHPEVYVVLLPVMGLLTKVVVRLARKPEFQRRSMASSLYGLGGIGCVVWGHHLFVAGLGVDGQLIFSLSTLVVAIPTALKVEALGSSGWGGMRRGWSEWQGAAQMP